MYQTNKEVQETIIGKLHHPNFSKVFALNKCLEEYFKLVKWYLRIIAEQGITSKDDLHHLTYNIATRKFDLPLKVVFS